MRIYDRKGMLIIPNPTPKVTTPSDDIILVQECYCQNGHQLIDDRVKFGEFKGIYMKVRAHGDEGYLGLSPIYGEKCRIILDIELDSGEILDLRCPTCDESLPIYSACNCGGSIVALFLNDAANFSDCIGICNRVDCNNASVRREGEYLALTMTNSSKKKSGLRTNRGII